MSKALIYAVNTEASTIAEGGSVPVGTVIHRFGCALRKAGNTIQAIGKGYFEGTVSATIAPTAAGTATITATKDGVAIPGAVGKATVATAGDNAVVSFPFAFRNYNECDTSMIAFVLSGATGVLNNLSIVVEKA